MRKVKILIFPGGTENALEIYKALKSAKEVELFSASSNVVNHADFVYKNNYKINDVHSKNWIIELNEIITKNKIEYIYPANSIVIDALNKNRAKILAKVILPDENVIEITRSKKETLKKLKNIIDTPFVYDSAEEISSFPVFTKPDRSYGAQGARIIDDSHDLKNINFSENIVQEYLEGKEYTIDCFSNYRGELLFSQGRERERIRMATTMHAQIVSDELNKKFTEIAEKIQNEFNLQGAWFFQLKEDSQGVLKLLEIDVRIAGTMCLNRVRGVNFALLTIMDFLNLDVSIMLNNQGIVLDRCLHNRYLLDIDYKTIYVDLDDTLIVHNKLNLDLLKFLYQCINNNKKIVLISKNLEKDKNAYLKKWRIFELFDQIHWLKEEESKASYIKDKDSIFIDDSFSQRKEVFEKFGIPTFDNSMVEGLIDDRI